MHERWGASSALFTTDMTRGNIRGRGKSRWDTVVPGVVQAICMLLVIIFCLVNSRLKRSDRFFSNMIASPIAERKSEPVEMHIKL